MTTLKTMALGLVLAFASLPARAQISNFLDKLRFGFGAGPGLSQIVDLDDYAIYEDMEGASYLNTYSGLFRNWGNQYFIQAEYTNGPLIVVLKPGTYTARFSRLNEIIFATETVALETPYLLRSIAIPLEVRYQFDLQRFRPSPEAPWPTATSSDPTMRPTRPSSGPALRPAASSEPTSTSGT
ncbi:MAG: hypothetical protein R2751_14895 [Bacteroidales bacterium]